ncbi:MAG: TatD family hydrolase [Acutalibacteraceae bacterium]|jgi:TatD DNase family protein
MMEFINETPLTAPLIFDSHAHYDDDRFEGIRDELLAALPSAGVSGIITCGCDFESTEKAKTLSERYDYIYFTAGIHPGNISCAENIPLEACMDKIKEYTKLEKCVGIGEIGLDYYWTKDNIPRQKEIFSAQMKLSKELDLPVVVHDREAHADTLDLLKQFKPKGVLHSFSGCVEMAEEIYKHNMYIGINGTVTFKNARKLPEVIKRMPLDRFLLETDAPYLAPVPYRGKTNNSAMIYLTCQKIAEIREISVETVLKYALENTKRLYNLD